MATKLKTRPSKDIAGATEILALIDHPMETGQRPDPKDRNKKIPAHWIQKLTVEVNGKTVADVDMGVAISKDPLVAIAAKGIKAGDKISVNWTDSEGKKEGSEMVAA
jgi:sulfur-oxidizing protein SoxZ